MRKMTPLYPDASLLPSRCAIARLGSVSLISGLALGLLSAVAATSVSAVSGLCTAPINKSYALPADRGTTWNLAGRSTRGGVPSANWPLCNATPLAPSGADDDSVAINALIQSCAPGTVARLGAGTFVMGQDPYGNGRYVLLNKGVALRGAGAGKTILRNPRNSTINVDSPADATPIIIVGPARWVNPDGDARCTQPTAYQPAYMQRLSIDAAKGSRSVTVADGGIFKPGMFVLLDETSGASWQPDVAGAAGTKVWASPDYAVQWGLHQPPILYVDDLTDTATPSSANNWAGTGNGHDASCWFSRQDRPQNEIKEIAAVSGNTITFTSPLHKSYRASRYAELTTYTGGNAQVVGAGVENLSAVGGGNGGIRFENTAYAWAKNIEVTAWWGEGVAFDGAFRTELRDSYIHDTAWPSPGGAGYIISTANASSELLIENNIFARANKVMVARSSGTGSVVAYNYADQGYIFYNSGWVEVGLNGSHMVGSHHMLFEGNQSFNMDTDDTHGNSTYHTFYRNWVTSVRSKFTNAVNGESIDDAAQPANGPKRAAGAAPYSYWMSFVGNVLGAPGITTAANGYVDESTNWGNNPKAIWLLGWNAVEPYTTDPNVAKTALRDGNWDVLLGQQTWLTRSAAPLPASCYLTSKPAFFGANPWPWVDPATGATRVLPAKARYDAGTPNTVP